MCEIPETVQNVSDHNGPVPSRQTNHRSSRKHQGDKAFSSKGFAASILHREAYIDTSNQREDNSCKLMRILIRQYEVRWKANKRQ